MKLFRLIAILSLFATASTSSGRAAEGNKGESVKSVPARSGGTLEVRLEAGDVTVHTRERNEVSLTVEEPNEEGLNDLTLNNKGDIVEISWHEGWSAPGRELTICVPPRFNLDLGTMMGTIRVKDKITGSVRASTSAGDLLFTDVSGNIDVRTAGGDIRTGRIQGNGTLKTAGGIIEATAATGNLRAESSGGDIRIGDVGKSLHARTGGGNISVGNVGAEAAITSSGGSVKVGKVGGKSRISTEGGDIQLQGSEDELSATTEGGDIVLDNVIGSINAITAGGDVQVDLIPRGRGKSRLSSADGNVWLYLPSDARATIEALIRVQGSPRKSGHKFEIRSDFKSESYQQSDIERAIKARYILNGGGETITLETMNADIEILKSKKW
jgi:DUF4097 and DUF4098 domain-containing protein YvlB